MYKYPPSFTKQQKISEKYPYQLIIRVALLSSQTSADFIICHRTSIWGLYIAIMTNEPVTFHQALCCYLQYQHAIRPFMLLKWTICTTKIAIR